MRAVYYAVNPKRFFKNRYFLMQPRRKVNDSILYELICKESLIIIGSFLNNNLALFCLSWLAQTVECKSSA